MPKQKTSKKTSNKKHATRDFRKEFKVLLTTKPEGPVSDALVVFLKKGQKKISFAKKECDKAIETYIRASEFEGEFKEFKTIYGSDLFHAKRLILVGLGDEKKFDEIKAMQVGGVLTTELQKQKATRVLLVQPDLKHPGPPLVARSLLLGMHLASFTFLDYKSDEVRNKKLKELPPLSEVTFWAPNDKGGKIEAALHEAGTIAEGCNFTRRLVGGPSNDVTPTALAKAAQSIATTSKINVTVWDKDRIAKEGFGGLLAVNQGSEEPPKFIIIEYRGGAASQQPIVLIGKGITFDTGGISLKPADKMGDMISDMGGAAAVLGILKIISTLNFKTNVVGLIPTTDNMPSGKAYKPGDVIRMYSGKTVEIISTDAEGRMLLADALAYSGHFKPRALIDIATLTGACQLILGDEALGIFGNNRKLLDAIKTAAEKADEKVFELPSFEGYRPMIDSTSADIKNAAGRIAGASTAGFFLKEFVPKNTPWVHMDIAGICLSEKDRDYILKGPTGVPVRLIVQLISDMS